MVVLAEWFEWMEHFHFYLRSLDQMKLGMQWTSDQNPLVFQDRPTKGGK